MVPPFDFRYADASAISRSLRYLLEFEIARARSPARDRDDHQRHRYRDQPEHPLGAIRLQEVADDEAGEHRADPAERIGEADRPGADAGREKFALIVVERVGHHI